MDRFALARENMIKGQILPNKIINTEIIRIMSEIQRQNFIPEHFKAVSYCDEHIKVGDDRYAISPVVLSRMIQAADISKEDTVLDIACGTGYSTAVLSALAKKVVAVESSEELSSKANSMIKNMNIGNAIILNNKLSYGCPESGPYDVILINGAIEATPHILITQLNENGRIVTAILKKNGIATITLFKKNNGITETIELFDSMVPLIKEI
ncbi:MAG: hypothetical protein COV35_02210 [Alphaproteobacteria bacterium CG11_big_fil_rev_8_21_14_0_20_39_49]|nr:MAG: hypothetical protein COV35_02210 [Alphaproteobacteria bacterium CG11_big_fil_rev_8_21_14_0_20_39_49]